MHHITEQHIMRNWKDMFNSPVVSVCCIAYNHEKYICEAINGFLIQETNFAFEIIIRDDCSTDETATIIKSYAKMYPNLIKPIFEVENQYSKGIKPFPSVFKKSLGNYIALCEGDDYWTDPKKLQIQVDAMRQTPECHMSFHIVNNRTGNSLIDNQFKYKQTTLIKPHVTHQSFPVYSTEEVIVHGGYYIPTPSVMFDRRVIEELPSIYYKAPIGDYILKVLGSLNGGALYINRVMSTYRVLSDGSWSYMHNEDVNLRIEYYIKAIDFLGKMNEYLNKELEAAIAQRKSVYLYALAGIYLNINDFPTFKKYIQLTFHTGHNHPYGIKLCYYLKDYPKFLQYLKKAKQISLN